MKLGGTVASVAEPNVTNEQILFKQFLDYWFKNIGRE